MNLNETPASQLLSMDEKSCTMLWPHTLVNIALESIFEQCSEVTSARLFA